MRGNLMLGGKVSRAAFLMVVQSLAIAFVLEVSGPEN